MRLGIGTYAYAWAIGVPGHVPQKPMTAVDLINRAVELNIRCVQIDDNIALHEYSQQQLADVCSLAQDQSVAIEVGTRGLTPENLNTYLELADYFRSPILRMVIDQGDYRPSVSQCVKVIKEHLGLFQQSGIKLAIENHDRFKSVEFERLVLESDPEWVGICLDSVNSIGAGEGIHTIVDALARYTINLHVKEYTVKRIYHQMGFEIEGAPVGQGLLPLHYLFDKVAREGDCQSAILETWPPPEDSLEGTIEKEDAWVRTSIDVLNKMDAFFM